MMLAANARLAENIKAEIAHNPYPHHLNMTPRDKGGARVRNYPRIPIRDDEVNAMHSKFFVSEKPEQDEDFKRKFTKHMYAQFHKELKTLKEMGNDPFKKTKEEMFKMKNEAKYSSKFVGPCMDMGSRPNWNYNEYHGGISNPL